MTHRVYSPGIGERYVAIFARRLRGQLYIYAAVSSHGIDMVSSKAHIIFCKALCIESNDVPISYKGSALGSALMLASKEEMETHNTHVPFQ